MTSAAKPVARAPRAAPAPTAPGVCAAELTPLRSTAQTPGLPSQVRAFVCGPLIAGLMLAAAPRPTHAQALDTFVGERVAAVARQASRAGQPARRFDLTLDDAVQRALERNLDIAVQRIHPLVQDMRVAAAGAAFLPVASSGFDFNQETTPNRFVFDGGGLRGQPIVSDRGTYDLGVGQQVKWGGGRYDVAWDSTRSESTNIFSTFNPSFGANMTLQYTQPLLRGFRTDARRTQLVVSRINRDISDIDLEETVVNTLADVSLAYWDLVYARAAVDVQRQAVALAEQLVADNRVRVEVGTMAPIDVVQAQSEAAARRQLLALAVETQRTSELALKELIVGGTSDEMWNAEINPTDEPRIEAAPIDLQGAIRGALERRTDVSRARRQLDVNEATVDNLRNSTLPALDLVGSYRLTGQGGPRRVPAGNSFEDPLRRSRRRDPGRLRRCAPQHCQRRLPGLERAVADELPARPERGSGRVRTSPDRAAAEPDPDSPHRAADSQRGHQRGASHRVDSGAHRGRDGVAGAGRTTARGGGEQVRGRPVDELLRSAVAARSGYRAGCRATRRFSTTSGP